MKINKVISPNYCSRGKYIPDLIVYHICDGYYQGSIAWFQQTKTPVSAHFVVSKKGEITQTQELTKGALTQGLRAEQIKFAKHELVRKRKISPNPYCISIEFEGFYKDTHGELTPEQLDSAVELTRYIQKEVERLYNYTIPFDRKHLIGHCEINPKNRPFCPGEKFPYDEIIKRLNSEKSKPEKLYTLQFGAFKNKENAENYAKLLTKKGIRVIIKERDI